MNTLYFECQMGAAGDMLTASLLSLFDDPQKMVDELNHLGIPDVKYTLENVENLGIRCLRVHVCVNGIEEACEDIHAHHHHDEPHDHPCHHHDCEPHDHHCHHHDDETACHVHHHHGDDGHGMHHHATLEDIRAIVDKLAIDEAVRSDIMAVYGMIANAESVAHGVCVEEIHFHEVGSMDAVADIAAVCYLMHALNPSEVVCSPIHVGSGHVRCAHGILPVPAPATAWLLRDIPCYGGQISGELCTPTGAALLKHFVTEYAPMPVMRISKIGYGMGQKVFPVLNCVRVFMGEQADQGAQIVELSCNLDDMTAEDLAFAQEQLFEAGAVEVYTTPVVMKKSRSGVVLTVHAPCASKESILQVMFKYTTTLGIREAVYQRYTLNRHIETVDTPLGKVHIKYATGYGVERCKYEYEDLARLAREHNISLEEVKNIINHKWNRI